MLLAAKDRFFLAEVSFLGRNDAVGKWLAESREGQNENEPMRQHWLSCAKQIDFFQRSAPQNFLHRLSLGQFIDQFIQVPYLTHGQFLNLFDADAANDAFDQRS